MPDEAIEQLLAKWSGALGRLAASYERTRAGRDELLQDIVFALWRAWPTFRHDCSERAFVFRVAHNQAISRTLRRPPAPEPLDDTPEPASPSPGSEELLADRQLRARLHAAVTALPLIHREVMLLFLEDLSHAEIAEVLGLTENNVAVRLTRARAELKQRLGDLR